MKFRKWCNNILNKLTTVEVIIQKPNGEHLPVRTACTLEEVLEDYKDTGCKVISYGGKFVREETEDEGC